ncbi:MAG: YncE family protein [Gemmatimonadales bacterium]
MFFLLAVATVAAPACDSSTSVVILVPGALELAPRDTAVPQGGTVQLQATVYDTAGEPIPLRPAFESSDPSILTVTTQGLVRSVGPRGAAAITATLGPFVAYTVITVFDSSLAARVPLGGRPHSAAIAPSGATYVAQVSRAQLARVDLASRAFIANVAVGQVPTEVTFNSTATRAYVTNQFSQNVGVVDVATNTQIDAISVTGDPFAVIVTPGDSILYVTTNVDSVYGIRLSTKAVVAAFAVPATANGFVARDTLLYVSTRAGGTVVEFNLRTRTVSRTFVVGGMPQKMTFSANGNELYIANEMGYVQFWNLGTGAQIGTNLALPGGGGFGIALRPSDGRLYVTTAYYGGGSIHIVNPTTRVVTRTIQAGGDTRRVVFNATGTIGFVPNEGGWLDYLK